MIKVLKLCFYLLCFENNSKIYEILKLYPLLYNEKKILS